MQVILKSMKIQSTNNSYDPNWTEAKRSEPYSSREKRAETWCEWCRRRCRVSHLVKWCFWHDSVPFASILVRLLCFLRLIIIIGEQARNHFQVIYVLFALLLILLVISDTHAQTHSSIESHRSAWHHCWIGGSFSPPSSLSLTSHSLIHFKNATSTSTCIANLLVTGNVHCTIVWVCANCLINYFIY